MTATVAPLQTDVFTVLRSFLLSLVDGEVIHGLGNGVPTPKGDFVVFTPLFMGRLATNSTEYRDPAPTAGTKSMGQPIKYTFQIDCYGGSSADWAVKITTAWRDEYGCNQMLPHCQPLYCDEPRMIPQISGEQNYVQRWSITAHLQYNPITTVPQQFFDSPGQITLTPN